MLTEQSAASLRGAHDGQQPLSSAFPLHMAVFFQRPLLRLHGPTVKSGTKRIVLTSMVSMQMQKGLPGGLKSALPVDCAEGDLRSERRPGWKYGTVIGGAGDAGRHLANCDPSCANQARLVRGLTGDHSSVYSNNPTDGDSDLSFLIQLHGRTAIPYPMLDAQTDGYISFVY